ncbi:MAG: hypothetical protein K6E85_05235 [Lachnospiraceae bacterium]|nr:hypothetical protein [Lachnospiraceae bacterium]
MQTDKIKVTSTGTGAARAIEEASKFAGYVGLDKKAALRLRLLTEETLGMFSAITDDFTAQFWIESTEDGIYKLHLSARTIMDHTKKQELINASTDKKNAAAKGFMGKIRQIIENSLLSIDEVGNLQSEYGGTPLMYGEMGMGSSDVGASLTSATYIWSLEKYKSSIEACSNTNSAAKEAWDELEKSIVANIADDVSVAVKGNVVDFVISKKF